MFEFQGFLLLDFRHRREPSSAKGVEAPNLHMCHRSHKKKHPDPSVLQE